MFEPNSFETDTRQEFLAELCCLEMKFNAPLSVTPDEVHNLMNQPSPWMITEGPWPFSNRPQNWAS